MIVLASLGIVFAAIVLIVLALIGASVVKEWLASRRDAAAKIGVEWERQRLHEVAHWFSEDKPTMELIQDLAKSRDTWQIRADWQRKRATRALRVMADAATPNAGDAT